MMGERGAGPSYQDVYAVTHSCRTRTPVAGVGERLVGPQKTRTPSESPTIAGRSAVAHEKGRFRVRQCSVAAESSKQRACSRWEGGGICRPQQPRRLTRFAHHCRTRKTVAGKGRGEDELIGPSSQDAERVAHYCRTLSGCQ